MAADPAVRPVRLPPADLAARELPRTRQVARAWFRVHPGALGAIHFGLKSTHRYSHPACPYPMLYVAMDAETCLWERFGDYLFDNGRALPKTQWDDTMISIIEVPGLQLCDLSRTSTRSALTVDLTALMNADLTVPQKWGLEIQKHPARVPAIKFKSRFTGAACLAICERGDIRTQLKESPVSPLRRFEPALAWLTENEVALL